MFTFYAIARLNKLIGHKPYIVHGECFNRVFDCSIRVYRSENNGWAWALPHPNLATPLHGILVSTILKVLSFAFNTINNLHMFTGAHDKLVDKSMFATQLTQLKAAILVKVYTTKLFVDAA